MYSICQPERESKRDEREFGSPEENKLWEWSKRENIEKEVKIDFYSIMKDLEEVKELPIEWECEKELYNLSNLRKEKTLILDLDKTLIKTKKVTSKVGVPIDEKYERRDRVPWIKIAEKRKGEKCIYLLLYVRPDLNWFLEEMNKYFDLVLFTASHKEYADNVLKYIDPHDKYFKYKFYRDNCTLHGNYAIKDLSLFFHYKSSNDIILLDDNATLFPTQLNNLIPIFPFLGKSADHQLRVVAKFLKRLNEEKDVRCLIKYLFGIQNLLETIIS